MRKRTTTTFHLAANYRRLITVFSVLLQTSLNKQLSHLPYNLQPRSLRKQMNKTTEKSKVYLKVRFLMQRHNLSTELESICKIFVQDFGPRPQCNKIDELKLRVEFKFQIMRSTCIYSNTRKESTYFRQQFYKFAYLPVKNAGQNLADSEKV